ncbi:Rho guanine nucleotide exchange factor [Malassezia cuniculi]|uniref:Rho guanine nucleotide exchange factor n=1 Tax=Malassezia cuniculi TaxID=948313 RepID=A0AAF0EVJ9_9BASI|nr:Rho guanine nucleotide exchange factor [Malassezia cuniculi]
MSNDAYIRTDAYPDSGSPVSGASAGVDGLIDEINAALDEYSISGDGTLAHKSSLASVRSSPATMLPVTGSPEMDRTALPHMPRQASRASMRSFMSDGPRRRPLPSTPRPPQRGPRHSLPPLPHPPPSAGTSLPPTVPDTPAPMHPSASPQSATVLRRAMSERPPAYDRASTPQSGPSSAGAAPVVNMALLSQLAQLLACCVGRSTHIKRSVSYPRSFTGHELVEAIKEIIRQYLASTPRLAGAAGMYEESLWTLAMRLARSLKMQLYIHEVDWVDEELTDGVDDVYMFFFECAAGSKALDMAPDGCVLPLPAQLFSTTLAGPVLSPVAAAAIESAPMYALPTGVLVPLTACYSPSCGIGGYGSCYSHSCPRARRSQGILEATQHRERSEPFERAWVETVPAYIVASVPKSEVKRQNAILEFIQKEEAFERDLLLLDEFVAQLRREARTPLHGAELEAFITDVFFNYRELLRHVRAFVQQLHVRQREQSPVVQHLGDIVLAAALEWGHVYTAYVQHYPIAVDRLKRETAANPRIAQWVDECRRHPRAQRHPLDNFLFRAPARLQRYHLHMESVLKHTDPGNEDVPQMELALDVIDEQCKVAQAGVEASERMVQAGAFARDLEARNGAVVAQFALGAPERTLVHHGTLYRRPDSFEFDWTELTALLYDNCFILARRKRDQQLALYRRPIAMDFFEAVGFEEPPLLLSQRRTQPQSEMSPFLVRHSEGLGELLLMYAQGPAAREEWRQAFQRAAAAHAQRRSACAAFTDRILAHDGPWSIGEVSCVATFRVRGERIIALGGSEGLWFGLHGAPNSIRKVLHLRNVTQCALLTQFGRFIVLADHTLYSYSLEALIPSGPRAPKLGPLKLSGHRDVHAFAIGELHGRTVLAYSKKKSTEMSVRVLHAVNEVQMETAAEYAQRRLQHRSSSATLGEFAGFTVYTKFYVYIEAICIHFLFGRIAVGTPNGFQQYDTHSASWGPLPDMTGGTHDIAMLSRAIDGSRGLGIFEVPDLGFLMCYDRCAFYVDAQGRPTHPELFIEWEMRPQRVAFVAGHVVAVCPALLAIHSAHTGELVQLLRYPSVRLLTTQYTAPKHMTDDDAVVFLERVRTQAGDVCTFRELAP